MSQVRETRRRTHPHIGRRRRRRLRRAMAAVLFLLMALGISWFFESQATTTIIVISASALSEAPTDPRGLAQRQAQDIARLLSGPEYSGQVDAIYVPDRTRARTVAEPLARAARLPLFLMDFDQPERLVRRALKDYKGERILVVARPGELREIVVHFRGEPAHRQLPESESLYVLTLPWLGPAETLRLRYGSGGSAEAEAEASLSGFSNSMPWSSKGG